MTSYNALSVLKWIVFVAIFVSFWTIVAPSLELPAHLFLAENDRDVLIRKSKELSQQHDLDAKQVFDFLVFFGSSGPKKAVSMFNHLLKDIQQDGLNETLTILRDIYPKDGKLRKYLDTYKMEKDGVFNVLKDLEPFFDVKRNILVYRLLKDVSNNRQTPAKQIMKMLYRSPNVSRARKDQIKKIYYYLFPRYADEHGLMDALTEAHKYFSRGRMCDNSKCQLYDDFQKLIENHYGSIYFYGENFDDPGKERNTGERLLALLKYLAFSPYLSPHHNDLIAEVIPYYIGYEKDS